MYTQTPQTVYRHTYHDPSTTTAQALLYPQTQEHFCLTINPIKCYEVQIFRTNTLHGLLLVQSGMKNPDLLTLREAA
jgi:hypothetical protein